ncbi:unnamed protein product [Clonostachys solani]|uniref:Uncharacterized protein n=1 Tax=Clonostachys solani TaxID=160281 RepID=A0A9N9Z7Y4_9HYPO|nr:unnamed protein product [Clonostachys solani]
MRNTYQMILRPGEKAVIDQDLTNWIKVQPYAPLKDDTETCGGYGGRVCFRSFPGQGKTIITKSSLAIHLLSFAMGGHTLLEKPNLSVPSQWVESLTQQLPIKWTRLSGSMVAKTLRAALTFGVLGNGFLLYVLVASANMSFVLNTAYRMEEEHEVHRSRGFIWLASAASI